MNRRALVRRPSPRLAEGLLTHLDASRSTSSSRSASGRRTSPRCRPRAGRRSRSRRPTGLPRLGLRRGHRGDVRRPGRHHPPGRRRAQARDRRHRADAARPGLPDRPHRGPRARSTAATSSSTTARSGSVSVGAPTRPASTSSPRTSRRSAPRVVARTADQGAAPEVGGHRAARRHRRGLGGARRRPGRLGSFLAVPEEPGSHVVLLDEATVLMSTARRGPARSTRSAGCGSSPSTSREYEKLEGCVTCLSVRLRG